MIIVQEQEQELKEFKKKKNTIRFCQIPSGWRKPLIAGGICCVDRRPLHCLVAWVRLHGATVTRPDPPEVGGGGGEGA